MAREDRGAEDEEWRGVETGGSRSVGGWVERVGVGEADCTRCAVRLTACALRRRPTTLLFEKGREGLKGEGAMVERGWMAKGGRQRQR